MLAFCAIMSVVGVARRHASAKGKAKAMACGQDTCRAGVEIDGSESPDAHGVVAQWGAQHTASSPATMDSCRAHPHAAQAMLCDGAHLSEPAIDS